jgi:hypothetical protein
MPQPRIAAVSTIGLTFLPDRFKDVDLTLSSLLMAFFRIFACSSFLCASASKTDFALDKVLDESEFEPQP